MQLLGLTVSSFFFFLPLSHSLSLSLSLSLLLPEPFAKQNYLYRECKCRAPECLCKACERSGTASIVTSSRPTQNTSKGNTGTASIPSGDCLPDGWYCQCFCTRNSSSRSVSFAQDTMEMTPPHRQGRTTRLILVSWRSIYQAQASCNSFLRTGREQLNVFTQCTDVLFDYRSAGEKSALAKTVSQLLLRWIWPLTQEGSQSFHLCRRYETARSCCKFK